MLYDRAPASFHPTSIEGQHALFQRILPPLGFVCTPQRTPFTEVRDGEVHHRMDRPALLVSSTSWTVDEDFHILLNALQTLDQT